MSTRGTMTSAAVRSWTLRTLPISTRSCAPSGSGPSARRLCDHLVDGLAQAFAVARPPHQPQQAAQTREAPILLGLAAAVGRLGVGHRKICPGSSCSHNIAIRVRHPQLGQYAISRASIVAASARWRGRSRADAGRRARSDGEMVGKRLALLRRLARDRLEREHDIAEQQRRPGWDRHPGVARPGRRAHWSADRPPRQSRLSCCCAASSARLTATSITVCGGSEPAPCQHASASLMAARASSSASGHGLAPSGARRGDVDRRAAQSDHSSACARRAVARLVGADDAGDQLVPHDIAVGKADDRDALDASRGFERLGEAGAGPGRQIDLGRDRRSRPCASPRRAGSGTSSSAPAWCSAPRRG